MKNYGAKDGGWALITGASYGIGYGFAEECASRGFNIVLVARTAAKLKALAEMLEERYKVKTFFIPVDCSQDGAALSIMTALKERPDITVRLLVNNVGISLAYPDYFEQNNIEELKDLIKVNCLFGLEFTRYILADMKKTGMKCAIVNLSSVTAYRGYPFLCAYASSKAFMSVFSESLHAENRSGEIDVLSLTPGYVMSEMSGFKRKSLVVITARRCAQGALDAIGCRHSCGYWLHALQCYLTEYLPTGIIDGMIMSRMGNIRAKHLRKLKKQ